MKIILAVACGGAFGTLFRFLLNHVLSDASYPLWTLIENILGSFLLGLLFGYVAHSPLSDVLKNGLGAGFCGSFTTMSTFSQDMLDLIVQKQVIEALIYVLLSVCGGLIAAFLGLFLGRRWSKSDKGRRGAET